MRMSSIVNGVSIPWSSCRSMIKEEKCGNPFHMLQAVEQWFDVLQIQNKTYVGKVVISEYSIQFGWGSSSLPAGSSEESKAGRRNHCSSIFPGVLTTPTTPTYWGNSMNFCRTRHRFFSTAARCSLLECFLLALLISRSKIAGAMLVELSLIGREAYFLSSAPHERKRVIDAWYCTHTRFLPCFLNTVRVVLAHSLCESP
jgi:hypothetical protein